MSKKIVTNIWLKEITKPSSSNRKAVNLLLKSNPEVEKIRNLRLRSKGNEEEDELILVAVSHLLSQFSFLFFVLF